MGAGDFVYDYKMITVPVCDSRQGNLLDVFEFHLVCFRIETKLLRNLSEMIQAGAFCSSFGHLADQSCDIVVAVVPEDHGETGRPTFHHA